MNINHLTSLYGTLVAEITEVDLLISDEISIGLSTTEQNCSLT